MQPIADLGIFEFTQIAIYMQQKMAKIVRRFRRMQVMVQIRLHDQGPDLCLDSWEFGGIERLHLIVLIHELFQAGDVVVHIRPHHGWDQVIDDDGMGAPLGLRALAWVVDNKWIDQGHIAQRQIRVARRR